MTKKNVHFIAPYIKSPRHPIEVVLVGAGGNGSQMLSALARIHTSLTALGKAGLHITVYDADTVSTANIGRQLFARTEVGLNKAEALVSRFNRFYGTGFDAVPRFFDASTDKMGNIIISCVDNVGTRLEIGRAFGVKLRCEPNEYDCFYWMDLGNAQRSGQVVLGSACIKQPKVSVVNAVPALPLPTQEIDFSSVDEKDSGPSCSLAEALHKQDLFINSVLSQCAASLLWSLFREEAIENRGFYLNLETLRMTPIRL